LEKSERRPAPETRAQTAEMPEIANQRLTPASLTNGNVDDFYRPGKISQETELSNHRMHFTCIALNRLKTRVK
jgi:hypothetical protein